MGPVNIQLPQGKNKEDVSRIIHVAERKPDTPFLFNSDYHKSAATADQLQRQEQLIRKLTADLKKEKEESRKKDQALRKYENFYREVKARSAQKAAQKTHQQRQHKSPSKSTAAPLRNYGK